MEEQNNLVSLQDPTINNNKQCIIEFQAFKDNKNDFIVKELVILDLFTNIPYYFLFRPPYSFKDCNIKSRRCNKWLTDNFHHICWNEGFVDYYDLDQIMVHFCKQFNTIYTTGNEKAKWISTYTTSKVVEFNFTKDFRDVKIVHLCNNVENTQHKHLNCALAKAYKMSLQWYSLHDRRGGEEQQWWG